MNVPKPHTEVGSDLNTETVSDSVQKLDGTIKEEAANVDGSVPKRPRLEDKANGLVHLEIHIIQKRYTGGSFSGSAVIVASGLCSAALGTDSGGSVQNPASLCGVVGLKTIFGRTDLIGSLWEAGSVTIIGPITATVEDAILVYAAISGSSPADRIRLNPAFILMLYFMGSDIDMADKLLSSSLNEWGLLLAASDNLNPAWAQTLGDTFLQRLILRDIQQNGT